MSANSTDDGDYPLHLCAAGLIATLVAVPIVQNVVLERGYEIAKQAVAFPLIAMAALATLLGGGIRAFLPDSKDSRLSTMLLAVFLAIGGVASATADSPGTALFGSYFRREGLITWLFYGTFFIAVSGWAIRTNRTAALVDCMLIASVAPAAYAIQQRAGFDFLAGVNRDPLRPGSTLGNPTFLAAYLAIMLPVAVARAMTEIRDFGRCLTWIFLALIQVVAVLATQSRGPLLAAIVGTALLAFCIAGFARARGALISGAVGLVVIIAGLVAINLSPPVARWAHDVPVLNRLAMIPDRDSGVATTGAARSAANRIGIWEAGHTTLAEAPPHRLIAGFGPDSAHVRYSAHVSPSVMQNLMRTERFGAASVFDRVHSDPLEIALGFGIAGLTAYILFFCVVMYVGARTLFGLSGWKPASLFVAITASGACMGVLFAIALGRQGAAWPAFGAGTAVGWMVFYIVCIWRVANRASAIPDPARSRMFLLAGLVSGQLVFWLDAQVNIPVLTTRLTSFALAALILAIAAKLPVASAGMSAGSVQNRGLNRVEIAWGLVVILVGSIFAFLPAATSSEAMSQKSFWWRLIPVLPAAGIAAMLLRTPSDHSADPLRLSWRYVAAMAGTYLAGAAGYLLLRVDHGASAASSDSWHVAIASTIPSIGLPLMSIAAALIFFDTSRRQAMRSTWREARAALFAGSAALAFVPFFHWPMIRGDAASSLAAQWVSRQPDLGRQWMMEAIGSMPGERFYTRQLILDLLGNAVAELQRSRVGSDPAMRAAKNLALLNLATAEYWARDDLKKYSPDPWVVIRLANVLQVRALRMLRSLDPGAGERAAAEAEVLFAQAYRMYPSQPLLLRNWAQMRFENGQVTDAYRLLDLMESLIPAEIDAYLERIAMARAVGDTKTIGATLERARPHLDAAGWKTLQAESVTRNQQL